MAFFCLCGRKRFKNGRGGFYNADVLVYESDWKRIKSKDEADFSFW